MYVVEGALVTKRYPEACLGQFGVYAEVAQQGEDYSYQETVWTLASSERLADKSADQLRRKGAILGEAVVEHITSLEQAEKYSRPAKYPIEVASHRKPDVLNVLHNLVPEGAELMGGTARLWKEWRIPSPYVYFLGVGSLLNEVVYEPDDGRWSNRFRNVEGTRTVKGFIAPGVHFATTTTKTIGSR